MKNLTMKTALILISLTLSAKAMALQIGEVAGKKSAAGAIFVDDASTAGVNNALTGTTKMIVAISTLMGFLFAAKGLHMIYEASQPQPQSTYAKGIIVLLVGGALVSLPWVVFTSSNTIQGIQGI